MTRARGSDTRWEIGQRALLTVLLLTAIAFGIRYFVAGRQGLDIDEVFSLAIATGHSIEQPAQDSRAELGDFVQAETPQPASAYRKYAELDEEAAGPSRVIRAVFLSDTNPPLYYLVLNLWTRLVGTGDLALRLFSIILATICVPLTYTLAATMYGRRAGLIAASFMALAPQSVYYGSLGRMYPMLLLAVIGAAILTLSLHRFGVTPAIAAGWIIVSAAGLLTHYFFVFGWVAMCVWLLMHAHRAKRIQVVGLVVAALILVAWWYVRVPASMHAWRVTKGWLEHRPAGFNPVVAQVRLLAGYFTVGGDWLNRQGYTDYIIGAALATLGLAAIVSMREFLKSTTTQLLIFWIVSTNAGLVLFDMLQHTYARQESRYAFAAMPAALILVAAIVERLSVHVRPVVIVLFLALWANGLRRLNADASGDNPFRNVAWSINAASPGRVVVVHGIPTAVIGMARYLGDSTSVIDWVEALGTRKPEVDGARIAAASEPVTLVISPANETPPEAGYFKSRAKSATSVRGTGFERIDFTFAKNSR